MRKGEGVRPRGRLSRLAFVQDCGQRLGFFEGQSFHCHHLGLHHGKGMVTRLGEHD